MINYNISTPASTTSTVGFSEYAVSTSQPEATFWCPDYPERFQACLLSSACPAGLPTGNGRERGHSAGFPTGFKHPLSLQVNVSVIVTDYQVIQIIQLFVKFTFNACSKFYCLM
jgi:hypothetical protein